MQYLGRFVREIKYFNHFKLAILRDNKINCYTCGDCTVCIVLSILIIHTTQLPLVDTIYKLFIDKMLTRFGIEINIKTIFFFNTFSPIELFK